MNFLLPFIFCSFLYADVPGMMCFEHSDHEFQTKDGNFFGVNDV